MLRPASPYTRAATRSRHRLDHGRWRWPMVTPVLGLPRTPSTVSASRLSNNGSQVSMRLFLSFLLTTLALAAQVSTPTLDKPPRDIDDALRARIKRFYDYHVAQKTRLCEELITEASKDD